MNEKNPFGAHRQQQFGEHPGRFESDAQVWESELKQIAEYRFKRTFTTGGQTTIEVTKPDARISLRLVIGFAPQNGVQFGFEIEDSLDFRPYWADEGPGTGEIREWLAETNIWIAGCDDYGAGLRETKNLIGQEASPAQMIADGLWGFSYVVTSSSNADCDALHARVDIASPGVLGRFYTRARWVATAPISDRDWLHARDRMVLTVSPPLGPLGILQAGT